LVPAATVRIQHPFLNPRFLGRFRENTCRLEIGQFTLEFAARRKELQAQLETADEPPPLLHPEMADLYRQKVTTLAEALERSDTRTEATEALRGLIDAIVLTPSQGELQIELNGNLAAMLGAAQNAKRSPETGDLSLQVVMVAGARNQRYLQLWSGAA